MATKDTKEIKEKVLNEIAKTEKLIEKYKEMTKPNTDDASAGRVSNMNMINNKSIALTKLPQEKNKLKALQKVLSKIGTKDFGICLKCGKKIAIGRILIRPESLLCVNCAR